MIRLSMLFILILLAPIAFAQSNLTKGKIKRDYFSDNLSVGAIYSSFEYDEPGLMSEKGELQGIATRFETLFLDDNGKNKGWKFQIDFEVMAGRLDYDGSFQDGTPTTSTTKDALWSLRLLMGPNLLRSSENLLTLYSGLGGRTWQDTIQGSGGYLREIDYSYIPVGLDYTRFSTSRFSFGFTAEYDRFLEGRVISHLDEATGGFYRDIENVQKDGEGYRGSIKMAYKMDSTTLFIEAFYRRWEIEDSNIDYIEDNFGFLEPKNDTTHIGLTAGIKF